jgi:RHS repeat-associated protein
VAFSGFALRAVLAISLCFLFLVMMLPLLMADAPSRSTFTRSSSDQLSSASLAAGEDLSFSYDASHGQLTEIADAGGSGFSLSFTSDALLHLPLSQTVRQSGETLLSTSIGYDAHGLRASRKISAGTEGAGSSTTNYWYGGSLHPLVVTRDGVGYRLIGKAVVEQASDQPTRAYLHGDHLGSVRVVSNDQGAVVQSLGYAGDYGLTRIEGQSAAASFDSMASFYRFQGQEQEVFPLARLGIDDALGQWLDQIQLYHFPWRDYAAGLATFTQTDPVRTEDSLYSAFGANPVNTTDETGGMIGNNDATSDGPVDDLLDQLIQNPDTRFSAEERDLLRQRLFAAESGVQHLVERSEALAVRIAGIWQQVQQTQTDLQRAREEQARLNVIRLISDHTRQRRLRGMTEEQVRQYVNIVLHTATELSHRRTSPRERLLSDRYFQLQLSEDALQGELQMVERERQDLESWLDIYQVPIERMWDPDESASESEGDGDVRFTDGVQGHGSVSVSPQPSDEEKEDDGSSAHSDDLDETGSHSGRSPRRGGAEGDRDDERLQ